MITPEEAAARLEQAESAGRISQAAVANIRRWLTEAPFARYRDRLLEDIEQGRWAELDDAFFAVLEFGTGGRRGKMYPVGTNVLNERTIAESARGLADYVTAQKGAESRRSLRDRPRHAAPLGRVRRALRRGARGRRIPGLSCSGSTARPPCSPSPSGISTATPAS